MTILIDRIRDVRRVYMEAVVIAPLLNIDLQGWEYRPYGGVLISYITRGVRHV